MACKRLALKYVLTLCASIFPQAIFKGSPSINLQCYPLENSCWNFMIDQTCHENACCYPIQVPDSVDVQQPFNYWVLK